MDLPTPNLGGDTTPVSAPATTYFLVQAENLNNYSVLLDDVRGLPWVNRAARVIGPYDVVAEADALPAEAQTEAAMAVSGINGVIRVITVPSVPTAGAAAGSPRAA